jgi:hypothetical protein
MPNRPVIDLEISIHRRDPISFTVELRADRTGLDGETAICVAPNVKIDTVALRGLALEPVAYGQLLTNSLFSDTGLKDEFATACARADEQNADVRLRFFIAPTAVDLHRLRWETLLDPRNDDSEWLVTNEKILFSRYLSYRGFFSGQGWRDVGPRTRTELRPLIIIANPINVKDYKPGGVQLAEIPVSEELTRVKAAMAGFKNITELASGGKATLDNLVDAIRDGCNIVYLVAHGAMIEQAGAATGNSEETGEGGEAHLYLEQPDGSAVVIPGTELIQRLRALPQVPKLVVLASCQSGGKDNGTAQTAGSDGEFHRALGPTLAEIGVPAVIAMQGNVAMDAVATFMPAFFAELQRSGEVDRAVATARSAIQAEDQIWKPMLFMRLRSGRLWNALELAAPTGYSSWRGLVQQLLAGNCIPILGPGTYETLVGSRREMARRWAQENHFPMAPHDWNDLSQVAQYLAVTEKAGYPPLAFEESLINELKQRYAKDLPAEIQESDTPRLADILEIVGKTLRQDPNNLYRLLAELPFPIYITTDPSNLLFEALIDAKKEPSFATFPWTLDIEWPHSALDVPDPAKDVRSSAYVPDVDHPLIYHVFGHLENLESLVLTEDNIFDYLIGVTRYAVKENKDSSVIDAESGLNPTELRHIRTLVNSRLARSSLLFLGFPADDWTFRVLLRTIIDQPGSAARKKWPQLAVQVDPDDDLIEDMSAARRYMEKYLDEVGDIDVFWSGIDDFVKQLHDAVPERQATAVHA